jgi:hypothetical protein
MRILVSLSSSRSNPFRPDHSCHARRDPSKRCRLPGCGLRSSNESERQIRLPAKKLPVSGWGRYNGELRLA